MTTGEIERHFDPDWNVQEIIVKTIENGFFENLATNLSSYSRVIYITGIGDDGTFEGNMIEFFRKGFLGPRVQDDYQHEQGSNSKNP
jgi:hypothetical protein